MLRSPTALTLLADDGTVVGLLVAELRGRELALTLLCVAPEHRRRGAGRALVGALLDRYPDVVVAIDEPGVAALVDAERGRRSLR